MAYINVGLESFEVEAPPDGNIKASGTLTMTTAPPRTTADSGDPDLLTRTSWVNAHLAYRQIKKGKADGNTCALYLRLHLQKYLYSIGCFIQLHCGKIVFVGFLLLSLCCVGLKTANVETNVQELWVQEDGRLQKELKYTRESIGEGSGTTNELIIQTPKSPGNVLTAESLLLHVQAVLQATKTEIQMYGVTWKFSQLCYAANFPESEDNFIDGMVEKLLPCIIITPLDCFWEGSLLLGPDNPYQTGGMFGLPKELVWSSLNPAKLVATFKESIFFSPDLIQFVEENFQRAGITTAYQEKPCLNPRDPGCPITAPNKLNGQSPDIGAELTNGCTGFATKYMKWEEDLIVGGKRKNKTGHIVRAEALQSIIQLMGEKELYEYYQDHVLTQDMDWSQAKAHNVLAAWQRNFSRAVNKVANESSSDAVYGFTYTRLLDIMKDFSSTSTVRVAMGYVLMLVYACLSLLKRNDAVQSQSGIGMAGVALVSLSVAAGLGICSVMGIKFNASTTQIIPFLALGLGVDDMFLLAHTYAESTQNNIPYNEMTGAVLKRAGITVLLTSLANMFAFFTAAIIPIPALRAFSLQAGILVLFNMGSVLLIFPAVVSLDLVRREDKRVDVFCCFQSPGTTTPVVELRPPPPDSPRVSREASPPPAYTPSSPPAYSAVVLHDTIARSTADGHAETTLAHPQSPFTPLPTPSSTTLPTPTSTSIPTPTSIRSPSGVTVATAPPSTTSSRQCLTVEEGAGWRARCSEVQHKCLSWSLTSLAAQHYGPALTRTPVKVFVVLSFLIFLILGIWGTSKVKDGLDLTDVVPRETTEFKFLEAQSKYFGFYNIYLITQGNFDYANNQPLLYEYHQAFTKIKPIIKREDGSLPTFWLDMFRIWLSGLQEAFDKDVKDKKVFLEGWHSNASDDAILAFKLLAQTGDVEEPFKKDQVHRIRLVNSQGIIHPPAFYNYLTAWTSNDALAYTASMANFHPQPRSWSHDPNDQNFKVPKSQPLIYTQLPFFLTNLSDTDKIMEVIMEIRNICDTFSAKGLPNYPNGVPFTYWEQYVTLRWYLMVALIAVLGVNFFVLAVVLMNPWLAAVVVVVQSLILVELFGFMGLIGIKLSAVPAVILVMAVGIGIEFTLHVAVGFITAIGSRDRRMVMSLHHTFAPVVHGAVSTLLGVIMLAGAEFDFIVKYFFYVLCALVFIGLMNGLVLLPVLLAVMGPKGEVRPKEDPDYLSPPSPEPSLRERPRRSRDRRAYPRMPSDLSLSTISEEATQYSSHEIIVQPEVVVETTVQGGATTSTTASTSTSPGANAAAGGSRNSSLPSASSTTPPGSHVTKVKATATVKVEVHTPLPGAVSQEHRYKSKRRKSRDPEAADVSPATASSDSDVSNASAQSQ